MFGGGRINLIKLFGFQVRLDWTWFIIAVLLTWSLATGLFPAFYADMTTTTYWLMGAAGVLGLFASIILHESAHAVVARKHGMPIRGITLFVFGGVAEMQGEPPSAKAEFFVAIAGPIASILIALACWGIELAGAWLAFPAAVVGVFFYLALINGILVAFNMLPAFPLDGGRVLRSALWHYQGNLRKATRITSAIGSAFGVGLILLGVLNLLAGSFIGAAWWVLLGLFLRSAAQMSYQQVLIRRALEGEPVQRFMTSNPVTVSPEVSVSDLVERHVYREHHRLYPVTEGGQLVGCVSTRDLRDVPREEWGQKTVRQIARACSREVVVDAEEDAMRALSRMQRNDTSRLLVTRKGTLEGIVTLKDLMRFIAMKVELEEGEEVSLAAAAR